MFWKVNFFLGHLAIFQVVSFCSVNCTSWACITVKNIVISPNFLVWNRPKLCGNRAFLQNVHTRKLGEITEFFAVYIITYIGHGSCFTWEFLVSAFIKSASPTAIYFFSYFFWSGNDKIVARKYFCW